MPSFEVTPKKCNADNVWHGFVKPSPEDIVQGYEALKTGGVVTFAKPFLTLRKGEVIGYINSSDKKSNFLHWEIFSPAASDNGLKELQKLFETLPECKGIFKETSEITEDNFLEKDEIKRILKDTLPEEDKILLDDKKIFGKDLYSDALTAFFNNTESFANENTGDDAGTKGEFTYPVTLKIRNSYDIDEKSLSIAVEFFKQNEDGAFRAGLITVPSKQPEWQFTVHVPAEASRMQLKSEKMILKSINLDPQNADTNLLKSIIKYRWRNVMLEHVTEWIPSRLKLLVEKLYGVTFFSLPTTGLDATKTFLNVYPISWWNRKNDTGFVKWLKDQIGEADRHGEYPILGKSGTEKSLFEADPGDAQKVTLPADGKLLQMHPITFLWMVDILLRREKVSVQEEWNLFKIDQDKKENTPLFGGWCGAKPPIVIGQTITALLIFKEYSAGVPVNFLAKGKNKTVKLGSATMTSNVATLSFSNAFWGNWKLITDKHDDIAPGITGAPVTINVPVPKADGASFHYAQSTKKESKLQLQFKENCPDYLEGLLIFLYTITDAKKEPGETAVFTESLYTIPLKGNRVQSNKNLDRTGKWLIYDKSAWSDWKKITNDFYYCNYRIIPKDKNRATEKKIFQGDCGGGFKCSFPLIQTIQKIRDLYGKSIVIQSVENTGTSIKLSALSSEKNAPDKLFEKASAVVKNEKDYTYKVEKKDTFTIISIEQTDDSKNEGTIEFGTPLADVANKIKDEAKLPKGNVLHIKAGVFIPNGGFIAIGHTDLENAPYTLAYDIKKLRSSTENIEKHCSVFATIKG